MATTRSPNTTLPLQTIQNQPDVGGTPDSATTSTGQFASISSGENAATPSSSSGVGNISGKLAAGPVAGIAIGSAIAGALIGILAFTLLFGKKRRGGKRGSVYNIKEAADSSTMPVATASAAGIVESHLSQPVPDSDIGKLFSSIDTRLANHLVSFYGADAPATDEDVAGAVAAAEASGASLPVSAEKLAALLASPARRAYGLRVVAAAILLSRVGMEAPPEESLLPPGMAAAIHSMPPIASGDHVRMAFLSKWRTLSAFLHRGSPNPQDAQLRSNVARTVADIDGAIGAFASPKAGPEEAEGERVANLAGIVQRGTDFAATLFSQPAFWVFDWATPRFSGSPTGAERFTVFPALLRLTDEDGRPLGAPLVVEHPKVVET